MSTQRRQFPFNEFESKWQAEWLAGKAFRAPNPGDPGFDPTRPKYYVLDMFPYPSGDGLHVGHVEGYTATDILARFHRMRGYNVLHPMGWDAFGLPAEQYAIKTGQHPRITTERNVARFRTQLQALGFSYDWDREISTTDAAYVRWTQWIFLRLYHAWFNPETNKAEPISTYTGTDPDAVRLAYVAEVPVNWCQELGTVLANEEVVDGRSEVGGFPVERRPMRQWMLRITAFAERLLDGLNRLDWPESIKLLQSNWIGKSKGAEVTFKIEAAEDTLRVFTTRPDTLFGATYVVVSPEHPQIDILTKKEQKQDVLRYQQAARSKSDLERTDLAKEKTGVFTGSYAINPVNGERIPIWTADYVLMGYGTGAIMAVPAHDERDHDFAVRFQLPIRRVVEPFQPQPEDSGLFTGEGRNIDSGFLSGMETQQAKEAITTWLEQQGSGRATIQYKLRDWLFSRQRYWGEPFPIIWTDGRHEALPETDLPLMQPELEDFRPTGTPEPPLSKATQWVNYSEAAKRETNTMPQWAGSCWYYLRYCDAANSERFIGKDADDYWMKSAGKPGGVDLYVGGTEHAVLHLLYARFWHMVLFDLGLLATPEPFQRLVNQGIILGPDGQKMSKSRGNVVSPDQVIEDYGADSLRLYEMFMGPLEQMKPWSMKGVEGVHRFLARVWRLAMKENQEGVWIPSDDVQEMPLTPGQQRVVHFTIKKVTSDLALLSFNTAISQLMVMTNEFVNAAPRPAEALRILLRLLSPFAPHLAEEVWHRMGWEGRASSQAWPMHEERWLEESEVELAVQINGKVKERVRVAKTLEEEGIKASALQLPKIQEHLAGTTIVKVIVVPGKIVNIVVRS